jgi:hypothetical protein
MAIKFIDFEKSFNLTKTRVFVMKNKTYRYTYDGSGVGSFSVEVFLDTVGWVIFAYPIHLGYEFKGVGKSNDQKIDECNELFKMADEYLDVIC